MRVLDFIGKLVAITFAVNVTLTWAAIMFNSLRQSRKDPWPDRENL
jgi:hypothetical protein